MRQTGNQGGFSMLELLVSVTVLLVAMTGVFGMMIENSRINKSQQMAADVQSNARNSLSLIVQKLRSAGWDPGNNGIPTLNLDPDTGDDVSQIELFMDLDADGVTDGEDGEEILIRHINGQLEWRTVSDGDFSVLSAHISNDADGDGTIEPMFVPDMDPNPAMITVQITARSPVVDPVTGDFIRYTVSSDVVLRKEI
jgi:prepilin-type N-terminal cleavage/methylation domain-containing protein